MGPIIFRPFIFILFAFNYSMISPLFGSFRHHPILLHHHPPKIHSEAKHTAQSHGISFINQLFTFHRMTEEKFPIFVVAGGTGLIYEIETLKHLREQYHICGTLTGILPEFPQQNVFQGLPLQLMPEDVKLLVDELNVAYLVDDRQAHQNAVLSVTKEDLEEIQRCQAKELAAVAEKEQEASWIQKKLILEKHNQPTDEKAKARYLASLKGPSAPTKHEISTTTKNIPSYPMFARRSTEVSYSQPEKSNYMIFRHLQALGYYLSPGLRFGGQFLAYPGDPLRFHSHYIVNGYYWEEEIPILDIIRGGRLATNVKKSWVVGGEDANGDVKVFSIEWARFG